MKIITIKVCHPERSEESSSREKHADTHLSQKILRYAQNDKEFETLYSSSNEKQHSYQLQKSTHFSSINY
ncbi:MAG: hypothetical protein JWP94_3593 [Mucilaginibacter sp.]|nr:hypothetical protein [Mucilaginibacter sp.]